MNGYYISILQGSLMTVAVALGSLLLSVVFGKEKNVRIC